MYKKLILSLAVIACLAVPAVAMEGFQGRVFTETPRMAIEKGWIRESLKISPDGINIGMIVGDGSGKSVVVNGVRQKKYEDILDDMIYFTPDSQHVLYIARRNAQCLLVYDGIEHTPYAEIKKQSLVLSSDGAHFAYVAKAGGQWRVVQDQTEHAAFDDINVTTLKFSPDGKRLVYAAQKNGAWFMVKDGQTGRSFDGIRNIVFSPDSQRLAAVVRDGNQFRVVVNGEETSNYESIRANSLRFSPDSLRLGFIAQTGDYQCVVIDHVAAKNYRKIGSQGIVFSQAGNRYGYTALTEAGWMVVIDGQEYGPYEAVLEHAPVFSPNGKRVAYAAKVDSQWTVFVDESSSDRYDAIGEGTIIFSSDSRNFAYVARKKGKWVVPVNHTAGRLYDAIGRGSLAFGSRGEPVYSACRGNRWFMVFNGSEGRAYDQIITGYGGRILWESGFGYQVIEGTTIYYIAEKIPSQRSGSQRLRSPMSSSVLQRGQTYRFTFNFPDGKRLRQTTRESMMVSVDNESMRAVEREVVWESSITRNRDGYLLEQQFVSVRQFEEEREIDLSKANNQMKNAEVRYFVDLTGQLRNVQVKGDLTPLLDEEAKPTLAQIEQVLRLQWEATIERFLGKTFRIGDSWEYGRDEFPLPNGKTIVVQIGITAADEVKVGANQCVKLEYDFDFDSREFERFIIDEIRKLDGMGSRSKVKSIHISAYDLIDPNTMLNYGSKLVFTFKLNLDLPGIGEKETLMVMEFEHQIDHLN